MKKKAQRKIKGILISVFILIISFNIHAQKLVQFQEKSLRAPDNIKIDGKAIEWKNNFQTFNKATSLYYIMSNDDENLYLAIQAKAPNIIKKIFSGGITFTINNSDKHTFENSIAITYPKNDKNGAPNYINLDNRPSPTKDSVRSKLQADSFMNVLNNKHTTLFKTIGVNGISEIEDKIISIYNESGIKVAALFDNNIEYTFELCIPLKYLGLGLNSVSKFSYNIKLNGAAVNGRDLRVVSASSGDKVVFTGNDGITYNMGEATPQNLALSYPTDFWGEYTLAKR